MKERELEEALLKAITADSDFLRRLLNVLFRKRIPRAITDVGIDRLQIRSQERAGDAYTRENARMDIVITDDKSFVVALELKTDSPEQVGQYVKYRQFIERDEPPHKKKAYVFGILASPPEPMDEPFLNEVANNRISWIQVADIIKEIPKFRRTPEVTELALTILAIQDSCKDKVQSGRIRKKQHNIDLLQDNSATILTFFRDVAAHASDFQCEFHQYGNTPYQLLFGRDTWSKEWHEFCPYRIVLSLKGFRGRFVGPVSLSHVILLYTRNFHVNSSVMRIICADVCRYFHELGYRIGTNAPSNWHNTVPFHQPFKWNERILFLNAFAPDDQILEFSEIKKRGWDGTVSWAVKRTREVVKDFDRFSAQLRDILR